MLLSQLSKFHIFMVVYFLSYYFFGLCASPCKFSSSNKLTSHLLRRWLTFLRLRRLFIFLNFELFKREKFYALAILQVSGFFSCWQTCGGPLTSRPPPTSGLLPNYYIKGYSETYTTQNMIYFFLKYIKGNFIEI